MAAPASVSALPEPASSFSFIDTPLPDNPLQGSYDLLFTPDQVTKNTAAVEKYFAMGPCTIQEAEDAGDAKAEAAKAEAAAKADAKAKAEADAKAKKPQHRRRT